MLSNPGHVHVYHRYIHLWANKLFQPELCQQFEIGKNLSYFSGFIKFELFCSMKMNDAE